MYKEFVSFKNFVSSNKILVVFSVAISLLIYYLKMITPIIGMDTNGYLFDMNGYNKHWLSIGRVGEVLIKKYLWRGNNNIFLWNTLSIFLFAFSVIFLAFMISKLINKNNYINLVLPSLVLTSPLFVFQFYFVLQIFEFTFCIVLVLLSIYLIEFTNVKMVVKIFFATIFLGITFGVYNTFVFFYILLVSTIILFKIYNAIYREQSYSFKKMMFDYIYYAFFCVLGIIFYFVINYYTLRYLNITQVSHATNMIYWFSAPIGDSLHRLVVTLFNIFIRPGINSGLPYYNYLSLIMLVCILLSLYKVFRTRKDLVLQTIFTVLVLLSTGLGIVLITASADLPRTMVPQFPFMIAIGIYWSMVILDNKKFKIAILCLLLFFTCIQFRDSSNLVVSEKMTFDEDYTRMIEIDMAIKNLELNNYSDKKVILTGYSLSKNKFNIGYFGELVGVSMFNFAFSSDSKLHSYYVGDNILIIMDAFGMKYNKPSLQEYQDALTRHPELITDTTALRCFSDENYIYVNIR